MMLCVDALLQQPDKVQWLLGGLEHNDPLPALVRTGNSWERAGLRHGDPDQAEVGFLPTSGAPVPATAVLHVPEASPGESSDM